MTNTSSVPTPDGRLDGDIIDECLKLIKDIVAKIAVYLEIRDAHEPWKTKGVELEFPGSDLVNIYREKDIVQLLGLTKQSLVQAIENVEKTDSGKSILPQCACPLFAEMVAKMAQLEKKKGEISTIDTEKSNISIEALLGDIENAILHFNRAKEMFQEMKEEKGQ